MTNIVSVVHNPDAKYPAISPYHPPEDYPEYLFKNRNYLCSSNKIYPMVRECLRLLGLDRKNYEISKWNPLGKLIKPGNKVVLKPNFVRDYHEGGKDIYSVITHPSIIRAMIDYVYIALEGKGEIIVADAPLGDTHFDKILKRTKLNEIVELYKNKLGFNIRIMDLRKTRYEHRKDDFVPKIFKLKGDPLGYVKVNLGKQSKFAKFNSRKVNLVRKSALVSPGPNGRGLFSERMGEYLISKTILSADVIISLPKLKVHKKAGVSLNLKNMLGISGDKNCLPHFRVGPISEGGDEISDDNLKDEKRFRQYLQRRFIHMLLSTGVRKNCRGQIYLTRGFDKSNPYKRYNKRIPLRDILKVKSEEKLPTGDWYGNDTIWRTILDLNRIVIYTDKNGNIQFRPQRNFFSLIDGIIAGEKDGPLSPSPKRCEVLISGLDFVSVDLAAIKLMGFDYKKIPQYKFNREFSKIKIGSDVIPSFSFVPPKGWKGRTEKSRK